MADAESFEESDAPEAPLVPPYAVAAEVVRAVREGCYCNHKEVLPLQLIAHTAGRMDYQACDIDFVVQELDFALLVGAPKPKGMNDLRQESTAVWA